MTDYSSQPDETSGIDTYGNSTLYNSNYGTEATMYVGRYGATDWSYSFIKFDLSSIPSTATINTATLSIRVAYEYLDGPVTLYLKRVKRNWVESQLTWTVYSTGNNWQTGGCQGADDWDSSTVCGSASIPDPASGTITVTLSTTELKKLIDGTYSNYGWKMHLSDETLQHSIAFWSASKSPSSNRPKLDINYTEASSGKSFQVRITM